MDIILTKAQASVVKNLLEEILAVDERAKCSDKFFRNHFMGIVKSNVANGTYKALCDALSAPESDFQDVPEEAPTPKKSASKAAKKPL